jgi:anti-anti-sigma factor
MTNTQADGTLRVTVSGEFGFETARELLLVCKARWQEGATAIAVDMSGVTGLSSSGVGTLILLEELVGDGRFRVHLDHCAEEVRQLFSSGILDKYFKKGVVTGDDGEAATQSGALPDDTRA